MLAEETEGRELPDNILYLLDELSSVKSGSVRLNIQVASALRCHNAAAQRTTDLTTALFLLDIYNVESYSIVKSDGGYRCIIDGCSIQCATAPLAVCATAVLLFHDL